MLTFSSAVVLARILSPGDYGVFALAAAFSGFIYIYTDLGLGAAVVRQLNPTQELLSSAFWLNVLSGLILCGGLMAAAPLIAALYDKPQLVSVLMLVSATLAVSVFTVQLAMLERVFAFKSIAIRELTAAIVGAVVAVAAGLAGFGADSLAIGPLAAAALQSVMFWQAAGWWPSWTIKRSAMLEIRSFVGPLIGFNSFNYFARNMDTVLLAQVVSSATLGLYVRAYNLMMLPIVQVTIVLNRVMLPALVPLSEQPAEFRALYKKYLSIATLVGTPVCVAMATTSHDVLATLYGPRWVGADTVLTLLSLSGIGQLMLGTTGPVYQALGQSRLLLKWGSISSVVTVLTILAGLHWGSDGVAVALLARYVVLVPPTLAPCWRLVGLKLREGFKLPLRSMFAGAVMGCAMLGADWLLSASSPAPVRLIIELCVGVAAYALAIRLFVPEIFRNGWPRRTTVPAAS